MFYITNNDIPSIRKMESTAIDGLELAVRGGERGWLNLGVKIKRSFSHFEEFKCMVAAGLTSPI